MAPAAFVQASDGPTPYAVLPDVAGERHIAASWKVCTSGGSTGRPKVIVDRRPAAFTADTQFIGIPESSRVLVPGPLYHNAPFSAAVFALWRGSTVITMERFDAERALALIERHEIT